MNLQASPEGQSPFHKLLLDLSQVEQIEEDFGEIVTKNSKENSPHKKSFLNCFTNCEISHIPDANEHFTPNFRNPQEIEATDDRSQLELSGCKDNFSIADSLLKSAQKCSKNPQNSDWKSDQNDELFPQPLKAHKLALKPSENSNFLNKENCNQFFSFKDTEPVDIKAEEPKKRSFTIKAVVQVPMKSRKRKAVQPMTKKASGNFTSEFDSLLQNLRMKTTQPICTAKLKNKRNTKERFKMTSRIN
ncbi:unnamed protein product [Moneuplotes crassus]|uniref:Uncharacterized protein n=1 Tax=Euplotes crassus TaxID=5936 RepID=A0AAD1UN29_EUPCR|nr:unnamed protein product [Moneuplotes crassus]